MRYYKYMLLGSLFAIIALCEGTQGQPLLISVDPDAGNDTLCSVNTSSSPCQSLDGALGSLDSQVSTSIVTIMLSDSVHFLRDEVRIALGTTGVTIAAVTTHGAIVRCENAQSGIIIVDSANVTVMGVVLENCGPHTAGIALDAAESIRFEECIFRRNTGVSVLAYNVRSVEIVDSAFLDNKNLLPATISDTVTSESNLYMSVNSGAGLSFISIGTETEVVVRNCTFRNNTASENQKDDLNQLLFKQNGRGSAILIRLVGVQNSLVEISDCTFTENHAEVEGAAVYLSFSKNASTNQVFLSGNVFTENVVDLGPGGALSLNSYQFSLNNTIEIDDCIFAENQANSGGAVSFTLYDSSEVSVRLPDQLHFHNCSFQRNAVVHEGAAVGLFSLVHVDDVGFPVHFSDCSFDNNTSVGEIVESAALVVFRFHIVFTGSNHFRDNKGGGVELISAYLQAQGTVTFERNSGMIGGGLTMNDRCLLELSPGVEMSFIGNRAKESGGAIYAEFPLIQFSINVLNRLCFIQYNDGTGSDVPPQNWQNVSVNFFNNSAGVSGAAVYASTMHQCAWFGGNVSSDSHNILYFPEEIADQSPFHFQGNTLDITAEDVSLLHSPALATAPFNMFTSTKYKLVQSGEKLSIHLLASDQLNNSRETVWALESPDQSTVLDAIGTNGDTFLYQVPSFSDLSDKGISMLDTNFSIGFIPLNTLGNKVTVEFETEGCHPGYVYDENTDTCTCDTGDVNIVRCDENKRYLYLLEGIWGGVREKDGQRTLVTTRVLPGYLACNREGRLPGCRFQFDDIDKQCGTGRKGDLCGTCEDGYGVTMDLQSCISANCATGLALFLLCCILIVTFSLAVLYFNILLPNGLKGFFFYAQVIAVIYRAYIVTKKTEDSRTTMSAMVNLLGYGLPLPLCLSKSLEAHQVAVMTYISPILVLSTVAVYTIAARFIKALSQRSALRGITFLFLIVYKYMADASFIFISCTYMDPRLVFLYDGSKSCVGWEVGILVFISLCVVALFVVPAPIAVGYICIKHPQRFHQWADVLTKDLKPEQRWWGGWDIGRRLPFVFLGYLLVVISPSIVLFLMSLAAIVILIVHVSVLPYVNLHTNIIEAFILALLLAINAALVESSSVSVPEELISLLIVLPYLYAICYIIWTIGSLVWIKYVPKKLVNKVKAKYHTSIKRNSNIEASNIQSSGGSHQYTESVIKKATLSMKIPMTAVQESNNVSSTQLKSTDTSYRQQTGESVRSGQSNSAQEQPEEDTAFREPLLDM